MKKVRSADTTEGLAQAFIEAAKGLPDPPRHVKLRSQDVPFWEAIVSMKPRDEWNEVELATAAQLARAQADIEMFSARMSNEPLVVGGRANPVVQMLEVTTRRELALMRALGLLSEKATGENGARSKTLKAARKARAEMAEDPLLAS